MELAAVSSRDGDATVYDLDHGDGGEIDHELSRGANESMGIALFGDRTMPRITGSLVLTLDTSASEMMLGRLSVSTHVIKAAGEGCTGRRGTIDLLIIWHSSARGLQRRMTDDLELALHQGPKLIPSRTSAENGSISTTINAPKVNNADITGHTEEFG